MQQPRSKAFVRRFVAELLSDPERNATAAYCRARGRVTSGAGTNASRVMRDPQVVALLAAEERKLTKPLGDIALRIRTKMLEVMESDAPDRVPAGNLLAKCTPGALAPTELSGPDGKPLAVSFVMNLHPSKPSE